MGTLRVMGHRGKFGAIVRSAIRHTISHHLAVVRSVEARRHALHSYSLRHATAMMHRHADTEPCIRRRVTDPKSFACCTAEPVDRRKQDRTGRPCGTRIEPLNRCYDNGSCACSRHTRIYPVLLQIESCEIFGVQSVIYAHTRMEKVGFRWYYYKSATMQGLRLMLQTLARRSGLMGCLTSGKTWIHYSLTFSEHMISQLKPPLRIRASATARHLVGLDSVWTGYTSTFTTAVTACTEM